MPLVIKELQFFTYQLKEQKKLVDHNIGVPSIQCDWQKFCYFVWENQSKKKRNLKLITTKEYFQSYFCPIKFLFCVGKLVQKKEKNWMEDTIIFCFKTFKLKSISIKNHFNIIMSNQPNIPAVGPVVIP